MKQAAGAEEDAEETVKTRAEAHSHESTKGHPWVRAWVRAWVTAWVTAWNLLEGIQEPTQVDERGGQLHHPP